MKIVVIGGSRLIGSKLVRNFRTQGHEAVAASPKSGVDSITGEGLADDLKGAQVVVDVPNSPSFEEAAATEFFPDSDTQPANLRGGCESRTSRCCVCGGNSEQSSIPYLRAKSVQEELIRRSSIPYSIVQATQYFKFVQSIADSATEGNKVRLPRALIQPIASDDVASAVGRVALNPALNSTIEIAGPDEFSFKELVL